LEPALRTALLGSIAAGRLVILCGAGLSMAMPSRLPSAREVAQICFDRYSARIDNTINPAIRDDLEAVAEWAKAHVDFRSVFIKTLVPWDRFYTPPNQGHEAIADFTLTKATAACLTANYDILVERCGWNWGSQFPTALDGAEATATQGQSPYLKFHGCGFKDQQRTVWAASQFDTDPELAARKVSCGNWIQINLQEKDLLFVGFWSDWSYLNCAISLSFSNTHPRSITLVDPADPALLQAKAPELWALAHQEGVAFSHVQQSGDAFLSDLRKAFSEAFLREMLRIGTAALVKVRPGTNLDPAWQALPVLTNDQLYSWRRDAEGRTAREPALKVVPDASVEAAAFTHMLVRSAGWTVKDNSYHKDGVTIRIVNGAGRFVDDTRKSFSEPPAVIETNIVICAWGDRFRCTFQHRKRC
jgi:hypothetical protein